MKKAALSALALVSVSALAAGLVGLDDLWDDALPDSEEIDDTDVVLPLLGAADRTTPMLTGLTGGLGFRVYHVDYDNGDDKNPGTTPAKPWKHAPGDPDASGQPGMITLAPGDMVRFRADVRYRGTIVMKHSGAPGRPITYTGAGYGDGRAIFDGADPVTSAKPCPSKAACGNAANWKNLLLVTFTEPATVNRRFYDNLGLLYEAQTPNVSDPFWEDAISEYKQIASSQYKAIVGGTLQDATLAAAARTAANPRLLIWRTGNLITERPILSASGSTIRFEPDGSTPYETNIRVAVLGAVSAVNRPGTFATIGKGQAIVYPRVGGGTLSIGNGRATFDIRGRSNITISDFIFEHGTSGSLRQGIAVANYGALLNNLTIENNDFQHYSMRSGAGPMQLRNISGLTIRGNRIHDIHVGSGIRMGGNTSNVVVENNHVSRVGRSGIVFLGVHNASINGNILSDMHGVHGNGLSTYLDNRNVDVSDNCIFDTTRPITFHGNRDPATRNNLSFRRNLLITSDDGRAAIYSWGKDTNGVLIEDNITLSTRRGMILNGNDYNVTVRNNQTNGIGFYPNTPAGLSMQNNVETLNLSLANSWTLTGSACQAKSGRTQLAVAARG